MEQQLSIFDEIIVDNFAGMVRRNNNNYGSAQQCCCRVGGD